MAIRDDMDRSSRLCGMVSELWTTPGRWGMTPQAGLSSIILHLITCHQGAWMGTSVASLLFVLLVGKKYCDFSTLLHPDYALLLL